MRFWFLSQSDWTGLDWGWGWAVSSVLGLQEKLLVEGLVLVAPFVAAAPDGGASIQEACTCPSGFKGEVQQVIQADLFGSCKLSRAELGPARLCYLRRDRERQAE